MFESFNRGQLELQGIKPKDHTKQNKEFIKTKQEVATKKKEEELK